jgi:hypothetical protein
MKKRYTYSYVKTVTGRITVTASSDEDAERDARDFLEALNPDESMISANDTPQDVEVGLLDLKDVEPDGPDRIDEE